MGHSVLYKTVSVTHGIVESHLAVGCRFESGPE